MSSKKSLCLDMEHRIIEADLKFTVFGVSFVAAVILLGMNYHPVEHKTLLLVLR